MEYCLCENIVRLNDNLASVMTIMQECLPKCHALLATLRKTWNVVSLGQPEQTIEDSKTASLWTRH
jgi:hypothetical protein